MKNVIEELRWRGMVHTLIPGTEEQLTKEMTKGYLGIDSTASSMHIGNLASLMILMHLQKFGHKPYLILGGATTRIGDPGGRTEERTLISEEEIIANQKRIELQAKKLLDFDCGENSAEIRDNYSWLKDYNIISFLREVGKHVPLGYMLSKESVKLRLETGISFAEFSYQVLQGYDFYYLNKTEGVKLQVGGSDQWGNLTSGTELIRRKSNNEAFAITTPLITKSDGSKFGKSEGGSIWLDPEMTSPYKFYQFWLNVSDQDAEKLIKIFTFLTQNEIASLVKSHSEAPNQRMLQKTLAKEVTIMIHSEVEYIKAEKASNLLFSKTFMEDLNNIDREIFLSSLEGVPQIEITKSEFNSAKNIIDFLTDSTKNLIFKSKGEARRSIQNNAVSINKVKLQESHKDINFDLLFNKYLLVQNGKKNYYLISIN